METFQPILLKDLSIELPSAKITRLAMNRHMPKVEDIVDHDHDFDQFLLYLRGSGIQRIGESTISVRRGSLIFLPKKQRHGFQKLQSQKPVCLAIDLRIDSRNDWPTITELLPEALAEIELCLNRLSKKRKRTEFSNASDVLKILQIFEDNQSSKGRNHSGPHTRAVKNWITAQGLANSMTPASIALGCGTTVDQLNRRLKRESGITLGSLLASIRFQKADQLLKNTPQSIGEIAEKIGFLDQNYFARWFKKQCGLSPSEWREKR